MAEYTQEQLDALIEQATKKATDGLYTQAQLQSEVDRRVESGIQKGVDTQRQKWEQEYAKTLNLSAEERAKQQLAEKEAEISNREKEVMLKANKLSAKELLGEANIPSSHYSKFLDSLISDNQELTEVNIATFVETYNAIKVETENKIKTEYLKVKSPEQGGASGITKEVFDKMSYTDKLKLKTENLELYKEFTK